MSGRAPRPKRQPAAAGRLVSSALLLLALSAGATLGTSFACARLHPEGARPPSPDRETLAQASGSPQDEASSRQRAAQPIQPKEPESYQEAIRRKNYAAAARLIDAAPSAEQRTPEVRYARALVALELDDVETALRKIKGLEPAFAAWETDVKQLAAYRSHDVTLISTLLPNPANANALLALAQAQQISGSLIDARKTADLALATLQKSKTKDTLAGQVRAHEIKAQIFESEGKSVQAAAEYRWLATSGAHLEPQTQYLQKLTKLAPEQPLTRDQIKERAKKFSEAGWPARTESELARLKGTQDTAFSQATLAWAYYYSRTDYLRAAQLFERAAAQGDENRQEYLYYEAKSLARSHDDHAAIAKYDRVAKMPGPYTDHAAYQSARLRFIDGDWKGAVTGYRAYLSRFGRKALHRTNADYDLTVALLCAGEHAAAQLRLKKQINEEPSARVRARLTELSGVALFGLNKTEQALATFGRVIDERPLSLPALFAAARLKEMGQLIPAAIEPSSTEDRQPAPILELSLPPLVARLARVGLDTRAEQELQSQERALRRKYAPRDNEALCRLYGRLMHAKRRYQIAQTAASWSSLSRAPGPRTAWQWDCIYPRPYLDTVRAEAKQNDISPQLIYAVMRQESSFRPQVVSPANAVGLMQIIGPTAQRIAAELETEYSPSMMAVPAENIRFGAYYLRRLLDMFGQRSLLAAAAYNAGPHALTRWLRAGEQLPADLFVARIPYTETRNYVYRVMGNMARYAYFEGGQDFEQIELALPRGLKAPADAY